MRFSYPLPHGASTQVLLIRHGQSNYNADGRFQGSSDAPELTAKGVAMADVAGRHLRDSGISAIISSPLRRAAETARRIAAQQDAGIPVYFDHPLKEVDLPLWEGLSFSSVQHQFAADYVTWRTHPHLFQMGDRRRPVEELFRAARQFWQTQLPRFNGRRILVVAHSGSCRALIATALGVPSRSFHSLQSSNGGISVLEFFRAKPGAACLGVLNATAYLGETLPKLKEGRHGLRLLLAPAEEDTSSRASQLSRLLDATRPNLLVSAGLQIDYELHARSGNIRPVLPVELWPVRKLLSTPPCEIPEDRLSTVLVLADEWVLRHLLLNALGLSPDRLSRLILRPSTLTALHYSAPGAPPVLQGMNLETPNHRNAVVPPGATCYTQQD